jgi:amino acid transporter
MTEEKLVRGISRWDLTAIAINTIIGTGIFILPAEVSSRFSSTGGMYLYAKEAFGPVVGFEVGWLYWIVRITTFATNCNALLIYLGFFFPAAVEGVWRVLVVSLVVSACVNQRL